MVDNKIYQDIAKRTNGDIYIGVVGPVRTGKSTFITKFMNSMVLPNLEESSRKQRMVDEMPQSGDGKVVMTTQPKFVPDGGVKIKLDETVEANIRLIDCVGYPYEAAQGFYDEGKERLVVTPWSETEIPFSEAARLGTEKVMVDHSTIGVVVTNDGSIVDMDRNSFIKAEEEIINKMKELNKPFVIVLNCKNVDNTDTKSLKVELEEKYNTPVIIENVQNMTAEDFQLLLNEVLSQFPLKYFNVNMPSYLQALPKSSEIISYLISKIKNGTCELKLMSDYKKLNCLFDEDEYMLSSHDFDVDYGKGKVTLILNPRPELFYKVLSQQCGQTIENEYKLVTYIKDLAHAKEEYDKFESALEDVKEYGYGVVTPNCEDMEKEPPEIIHRGNKCVVKLKATAPSYHILKVDVETEVNPVLGGESQTEEMLRNWLEEFENDSDGIWQTNMFGKSLETLAKEGIAGKIMNMPEDVRYKLRKALSKIINESKGGVICILL